MHLFDLHGFLAVRWLAGLGGQSAVSLLRGPVLLTKWMLPPSFSTHEGDVSKIHMLHKYEVANLAVALLGYTISKIL